MLDVKFNRELPEEFFKNFQEDMRNSREINRTFQNYITKSNFVATCFHDGHVEFTGNKVKIHWEWASKKQVNKPKTEFLKNDVILVVRSSIHSDSTKILVTPVVLLEDSENSDYIYGIAKESFYLYIVKNENGYKITETPVVSKKSCLLKIMFIIFLIVLCIILGQQ